MDLKFKLEKHLNIHSFYISNILAISKEFLLLEVHMIKQHINLQINDECIIFIVEHSIKNKLLVNRYSSGLNSSYLTHGAGVSLAICMVGPSVNVIVQMVSI